MASASASASASSLASNPLVPDPTHLGNGPDRLIHVGIAFLAITWVSMFLRIWTRGVLTRALGWDDYTMVLTMGSFTVQCAYLIRVGSLELHPERNTNLAALSELVTDTVAFSSAYVMTSIMLKISLALFFLRIVIKPWERKLIIYTLIIYTLYALVYFAIVTFGCGDPSVYLLHTAEDKCISVKDIVVPMSYAQTSANALLDWVYVFLPIHALWYLGIPRSTKLWASLLIVLGALGSIASLIRLWTVRGIQPGRDFFRESVTATVWATLEPGLGIAAVSLATTRPMFRRFIESTHKGSSYTSSQNRSSATAVPRTDPAMFGPSELTGTPMKRFSGFMRSPQREGFVDLSEVELAQIERAHHDPGGFKLSATHPLHRETWE